MARFANSVERKILANILADMAVVCDSEMQVVIAATVCICTAHLSGNMRELTENKQLCRFREAPKQPLVDYGTIERR